MQGVDNKRLRTGEKSRVSKRRIQGERIRCREQRRCRARESKIFIQGKQGKGRESEREVEGERREQEMEKEKCAESCM